MWVFLIDSTNMNNSGLPEVPDPDRDVPNQDMGLNTRKKGDYLM